LDPTGHYAEHSGYFETTEYLSTVDRTKETTYYDSVSGKPLFIAPRFENVNYLYCFFSRNLVDVNHHCIVLSRLTQRTLLRRILERK
jgi:hypothetical protein